MLQVVALVGVKGEKETVLREVEIERQRRPRVFKNEKFLGGVTIEHVSTDSSNGEAWLRINIPEFWDIWMGESIRKGYLWNMAKQLLEGREVGGLDECMFFPMRVPKGQDGFNRFEIINRLKPWERFSTIEIRNK